MQSLQRAKQVAAFAAVALALGVTPGTQGIFQSLAATNVPVVLPSAFIGPQPATDPVYAVALRVRPQSYSVAFWYAPQCNDATACRLGSMLARKPVAALHGTRILLRQWNVPGYFTLGKCGANCADSTLSFDLNGWRYRLAVKGASRAYMARIAQTLRLYR